MFSTNSVLDLLEGYKNNHITLDEYYAMLNLLN